MVSCSFDHLRLRANRRGFAAVEKVIILSGIVGLMTFSIMVLGKFTDCSRSIQVALADDPSALPHSSSFATEMEEPSLDPDKNRRTGNSEKWGRWLAGLGFPFLTIVMAYMFTLWHRPTRKPASAPNSAFQEVKRKLEPTIAPGNAFTKRQQTMAILLNRMGSEVFEDIRVGHLVSPKVTTVLPSTPLEEVKKYFVDHHFRHLFVCDRQGNLHGIISARDLQRSPSGTAKDIMSTDIVTASHDQKICPMITLMMERRISCLPVLDNERLLGIVTTTDLMIALQCTLQILHTLGGVHSQNRANCKTELAAEHG